MPIRRAGRAALRRVPPIARRDARIAAIEAENATLRAERAAAHRQEAAPSFYRSYEQFKRHWNSLGRDGLPVRQLLDKQFSYRLAASHGVSTPQVFGVWDEPSAITWEDLPEAFVLKTNRGSTSQGVFPCRRSDDQFLVGGADQPLSSADLVRRIEHVRETSRVEYPVFAEEWLRTDTIAPPDVPEDIKLYSFLGRVGMVMIRSVPKHGAKYSVRYLTREGEDLGDISPDRRISDQIPAPDDLEGLVAAAERLSAAVRSPFIRVDLYETTRGIVFGELTPLPGGRQHFTNGVDEQLGRLWEDAERRLAREILATGLLDLVHGSR